jgi:tRNA pseudouridine38-40 synthase
MLLRNIKLTLSYDGTAYRGFQDQGPGVPTIQGTLEAAVHKLTGERLRITGAGRTDAGVHALGHADRDWRDQRPRPRLLSRPR